MEWPSRNIPQGGVFHNAKVNYSPETKQFLQTLINESKMTSMQRNKINYSLRSGNPLPAIANQRPRRMQHRSGPFCVTIRPGSSKRRSLDTIKRSGAYERDAFVPRIPVRDREEVKEELQGRMAYGEKYRPKLKCRIKRKSPRREVEINRFDQLKQEIEEREDFLKDMEELGEGEKYRSTIKLQICERLREMEKLKISDAED